MAAKLTRLTHKIAIKLHLVAESCTICSSRSRQPVRKLLVTPSYMSGITMAHASEHSPTNALSTITPLLPHLCSILGNIFFLAKFLILETEDTEQKKIFFAILGTCAVITSYYRNAC